MDERERQKAEQTLAPAPRLELFVSRGPDVGAVFPLPAFTATLGSDPANSFVIRGPEVKPRHAELAPRADGHVWIRRLGGEGQLLVNGSVVDEAPLEDGTFIRLGGAELCLRQASKSGPYGTALRAGGGQEPGSMSSPVAPVANDELAHARTSTPSRSPAGAGQPLPEGAVLANRYRILRRLGGGGMGEVYAAEHVELGKPVAVKVMRPELSADPEFAERFKREAIAASRIGHKNICDVIDFDRTVDGRFYFVMEYLAGETLTALMRREGAMSSARVVPIVSQICRALAAAHGLGVVHRDLKPDNVVLAQTAEEHELVKVLDFGVAKVSLEGVSGGQTRLGMVVGTPQYMSPEQAAGMPADHRSDIYSLGLILYEMLCGRPTFSGATPSLLMAAHIHQPAPSLLPGPVSLPVAPALEALVMRMLAKNPSDRPGTMAEVAAALERIRPQEGYPVPAELRRRHPATQATPLPVSEQAPPEELAAIRPRRPGPWWLVAVLLLAGFGGGAFWLLRSSPPPPTPALAAPVPPPPPAPPSAAPAKVRLGISSRPAGAEVQLNGAVAGQTPLVLELERGTPAEVRLVLDGYEPRIYTFAPQRDLDWEAELLRRGKGRERKQRPEELHEDPYATIDELKQSPY